MQLATRIYDVLFCSQKPALKKVSKYENKFAKLQKKAAEFNFRNQLKVVKKKEFTLEEEDKEVSAIYCDDTHAQTHKCTHTYMAHNE
jgi:hypothetical protein